MECAQQLDRNYCDPDVISETMEERQSVSQNPYRQTRPKGVKQTVRTLLGVDFSSSRTGVAVSTDGFAPQPLMVRERTQALDRAECIHGVENMYSDSCDVCRCLKPLRSSWMVPNCC
jgi:hypothetical protein